MKAKAAISIVLVTLGTSTLLVSAQEAGNPPSRPRVGQPEGHVGPGGPGRPGARPPSPFVRALDTNRDRVIDADEIAGASEALRTLDHNNDGKLSFEDRQAKAPNDPVRPAGPAGQGHRPPPPMMTMLDANQDLVIDADELANATAALLALDENGDGELTVEEVRPPRPQHRPDGPPQGGPERE